MDIRAIARFVSVGLVLGLAWGAALRAWMAVLAMQFGETPEFSWRGAFGAVLAPAALVGAILGAASYFAEMRNASAWRWAILSPLLFVVFSVMFVENFIPNLFKTGLGSGALGVALIGILGGYAVSGFGPGWAHWAAVALTALGLLASAGFAFAAGIPGPREALSGTLFALLMILLVVGVGMPARFAAY
jgi:hypothetical protein